MIFPLKMPLATSHKFDIYYVHYFSVLDTFYFHCGVFYTPSVIWKWFKNFFFKLFYLFYLWLCWGFVSLRGLSLVVAGGGHSSSRCTGLSLSRPLLLRSTGSRHAGSVNCGSWAQLLRGMWDLPRPGLEPVSPALAGRFSTTAPPGKPQF